MFYDLNVPYTSNHAELQRTLAFLAERYHTIALTYTPPSFSPSDLKSPIPTPLPFPTPRLRILTRLLLPLPSPTSLPRLAPLLPAYTILSLRPTSAATLLLACQTPLCTLITLDLTTRLFPLPRKTLAAAIAAGLRFELCYAAALGAGAEGRRNLIANARAVVRATGGRGVVVSSGAGGAVGCRGPWDVGNLAGGWGLVGRGMEAVGREAGGVVGRAEGLRGGWRGVVDVVVGGEMVEKEGSGGEKVGVVGKGKEVDRGKRKAEVLEEENGKPVSKREMKRRAKRARVEAGKGDMSHKSIGLPDVVDETLVAAVTGPEVAVGDTDVKVG